MWIRQNLNCHTAVQPNVAIGPAAAHRNRRAFSLLEIMIAIGVLGIGLIMVAAIFPSALEIHRQSIEKSQALDMFNKAESVLRGRLDTSRLWTCPANAPGLLADLRVPTGTDSPWYIFPSANLAVGADNPNPNAINWDFMLQATSSLMPNAANDPPATPGSEYHYSYANCLNFCYDNSLAGGPPRPGNPVPWVALMPMDVLSDRRAPFSTNVALSPFTDREFEEAPNRFAWLGFYRRLANGTVRYAAAVTKINRGDQFAQQATDTLDPASFNPLAPVAMSAGTNPGYLPRPNPTVTRRLPAVWRVTVGYIANSRRLFNLASPEGLGELAPPGSKIMVGGFVWRTTPLLPTSPARPIAPAGKILTVVNVIDNSPDGVDNAETIDVLEDTSDLPIFQFNQLPGANDPNFVFDVLIIPPPITGAYNGDGVYSSKPSNTTWKVNL